MKTQFEHLELMKESILSIRFPANYEAKKRDKSIQFGLVPWGAPEGTKVESFAGRFKEASGAF
jgi:hypothetical protein